tara:strand:+ start:1897 stop:2082 length:186 start_codon:yes stop_codon:yes gene_type:complete
MNSKKKKRKSKIKKMKGTVFGLNPFTRITPRMMQSGGRMGRMGGAFGAVGGNTRTRMRGRR